MTERDLFLAALDLPATDVPAFLTQHCPDPDLRARVEGLLQAHAKAGGFLQDPILGEQTVTVHPTDQTATHHHATDDLAGTTIAGKYTLVEVIGEGGMGSVWRARQTEPVKRFVAIKLIKSGMDSKLVLARFEAERQALALMDHPNIAKVLDGGVHNSRPFFVMELVKGTPITDFCDAVRLTPQQRLELFVQACQAIQHAHQKGIIHRDIKPSNVLVALYDDKPVVKVIDFGVAKATGGTLTAATIDTGFGGVVGTPQYMSPEQATFNNLDIDTRSDVYTLGVLLYELLAGSPPFSRKELENKGLLEMLRVVREEEPPRPSTKLSTADALPSISANRSTEPKKLAGLLRNELDWIVMKALEKDRTRRYETANGFAADVLRYLSGEAVQAHPPSRAYRLKKFVRRYKGQVIAATLVLIVAVAGFAGILWNWQRAEEARQDAASQAEAEVRARGQAELAQRDADVQRQQAEAALREAKVNLYFNQVALAERYWHSSNLVQAEQQLDKCPADLRHWEWHYLMRLRQSWVQSLPGYSCVAFSKDGKLLAADRWDKEARRYEILVCDTATGKQLERYIGSASPVLHIVFGPEDRLLVVASGESARGDVMVWDRATGKEVFVSRVEKAQFRSVAISPNGRQLAGAYQKGSGLQGDVRLWDLATGQEVRQFQGHRLGATDVAFSPDGLRLASSSLDGRIRVWEVDTGKELLTIARHGNWVLGIAYSPDGKRIVSVGDDRTVRLWDAASGQALAVWKGHTGDVNRVTFSSDGQRVASASDDQTVRVWDAATGRELLCLRGHTDSVRSVAFRPDGKQVASASWDRSVKVFDVTAGQEATTLTEPGGSATVLAWNADGSRLATGHRRTTVVRDAATGGVVHTLEGHNDWVYGVAFSPDGRRLATAAYEVIIWDVATGKQLHVFGGYHWTAWAVAFSPDGRRMAVVSGSLNGKGSLKIWDTESGQEVISISGHKFGTLCLAFSPDGTRIATGSGMWGKSIGEAKVWDATTGQELMTLNGHTDFVRGVAYSRDGKFLATGSDDQTLTLWDAVTGQKLRTFRGHTGSVNSVAFHPDGQRLVSAGGDHTVKLWNTATGAEVLTLRGHTSAVRVARFSPDGLRLASVAKEIKIWDGRPLIQTSLLKEKQ